MRALHAADPICDALGIDLIDVSDESVTLQMVVGQRHLGDHGRCHGGVLFTLADVAMSFLSNRTPGQAFATHAAVDFLAPLSDGEVVQAQGRIETERGRVGIYDVQLRSGGTVVATFRGNTLRVD